MPRELTSGQEAARTSRAFAYYFALEVTLPLYGEEEAPRQILVSTAVAEAGGETYAPDVDSLGDVGFGDGALEADEVDFALTNLEDAYGHLLADPERNLYPAPARVLVLIRTGEDTFEPVTLIEGFARFGTVDHKSAKITAYPDTARKGLTVVELVSQRCPHVYKGPGCDSTDPSPTCSRIHGDAVNGCASKDPAPVLIGATNNQPSFGGVPQLQPNARQAASPTPNLPEFDYPGFADPSDPRFGDIFSRLSPRLDRGLPL